MRTERAAQDLLRGTPEPEYFEDATRDFAESHRLLGIQRVPYDIVCWTADVLRDGE